MARIWFIDCRPNRLPEPSNCLSVTPLYTLLVHIHISLFIFIRHSLETPQPALLAH